MLVKGLPRLVVELSAFADHRGEPEYRLRGQGIVPRNLSQEKGNRLTIIEF
jgi:hypothetical protein